MFYCEIFLLLSNSTASTGALPLDVQSTVAEAIQVLLAILRKYLLDCLRSRRSAKSSVGLYLLLASLLTIKFKVEIPLMLWIGVGTVFVGAVWKMADTPLHHWCKCSGLVVRDFRDFHIWRIGKSRVSLAKS